VRLGNENVPGWLGQGTWHRGEALAMLGQVHEGIAQMREGLAIQQKAGAERCYWSGCLCSLAEGYAKAGQPREGLTTLDKAQTLVEQTGERYAEAELYRLRAEILLMQGDDAGAEASLHKALEVARRQNAKLWELRAATSLARLWSKHGRRNEARQMLAEKYGWFSEGFDTPDLREAEALLEELS
jgi:predicted ATPase